MKRSEIENKLLSWMTHEPDRDDSTLFNELALALFAWQFEHCQPYTRLCMSQGKDPEQVLQWEDIPAVPTAAFKQFPLRCFGPEKTLKTFRTSGTSSRQRGELHLDTLQLYEASLTACFESGVLAGLSTHERVPLFILAPSPAEIPDSSLSHMFGVMVEKRGISQNAFFVQKGKLDVVQLEQAIESTVQTPIVCGTAFSFVHWMDVLQKEGRSLSLPTGTRLMETGGYKGKVRERSQSELYGEIEHVLGVPSTHVVNQYGMTELGSQFYDSTLASPELPRQKRIPPWTRVRIINPETNEILRSGESGLIQIIDLANTSNICAILTEDLGRQIEEGFEVLGRAPHAETRGCSIALDEMFNRDQ